MCGVHESQLQGKYKYEKDMQHAGCFVLNIAKIFHGSVRNDTVGLSKGIKDKACNRPSKK